MKLNFFDISKKAIKLLVYGIFITIGLSMFVAFVMYHSPLLGIFIIPLAAIVFIGLIIDKLFFSD